MLFLFIIYLCAHTRETRARAHFINKSFRILNKNTPAFRIAAPIPAAKKQTAFINRLALRLRLFFDIN